MLGQFKQYLYGVAEIPAKPAELNGYQQLEQATFAQALEFGYRFGIGLFTCQRVALPGGGQFAHLFLQMGFWVEGRCASGQRGVQENLGHEVSHMKKG